MNPSRIPKDAPNPENFAGFLVWQLACKWERYVNHQLKAFNTNQGECFHLISLWQLSTQLSEVTQVDIARQTGVSIMNTSKILKSLEEKQWITRQTASDSRAKKVVITEEGISIMLTVAPILAKANEDFYGVNHSAAFIVALQEINQTHKES